jgi:hypothetical protein
MIVKASWRSALILATGLSVCFAAPLQATPGTDKATAGTKADNAAAATAAQGKSVKPAVRHWKKYAHRKSGTSAAKSSTDKKATDLADAGLESSTKIPPWVANANAQLASAEAPADSARAMSARAGTMLLAAADKPTDQPAGASQVVAADQLNELDRALHESKPMALASAEPQAAPATARSQSESAWDQTSLIGKIFIGFGALLTMASAARMFMA